MPASANSDGRRAGRAPPGSGRAASRRPQRGARVAARRGRPPGGRTEQRRAGGQQGGPAVVAGPVQQQAVAVVGVALAGRAQAHVDDGGQGVGHAPQGVPDLAAERMAGQLALEGGGQAELEHEAVVVGGQLAVQAAGERLPARARAGAWWRPPHARRCSPGTRGRRSPRRTARPSRPGGGCWPTTRGSAAGPATPGGDGAAAGRCGCPRTAARPRPSRPAAGGSRPRTAAARRARCRWSSGCRTGTGWPPTRSGAAWPRPRRTARRHRGGRRPPARSGAGGATAPTRT